MRPLLACVCASIMLWANPSRAEDATGRVRGVFHEAARGVVVDDSMLRKPAAARWADVELDGGQRVLVQVPRGIDARVGDLAVLRDTRILRIVPATRLAAPAD